MFKGLQETVRDNKSSSYPVFELPGVNSIYLFFDKSRKQQSYDVIVARKKKHADASLQVVEV